MQPVENPSFLEPSAYPDRKQSLLKSACLLSPPCCSGPGWMWGETTPHRRQKSLEACLCTSPGITNGPAESLGRGQSFQE